MADIEEKRLAAISLGNDTEAIKLQREIEKYMDSKTEYIYDRKGRVKISKGAFDAKDGEIKIIDHLRNMTPEMAGALAQIMTSAGLAYLAEVKHTEAIQQQMDSAIKNAEQKVNSQIDGINNTFGRMDGKTVSAGVENMTAEQIKLHALGERGAELKSGFNTQNPSYPQFDKLGVDRGISYDNAAKGFTPTGNNNVLKVASILDKQASLSEQAQTDALKIIEEAAKSYYSNAGHMVSHGGVDHAISSLLEQNASNFGSSTSTFLKGIATYLKSVGSIENLEHIALKSPEIGRNIMPILIALSPSVAHTVQEQLDAKKKKVKEPKKEIKNKPKTEKRSFSEKINNTKESLKDKISNLRKKVRKDKKQDNSEKEER